MNAFIPKKLPVEETAGEKLRQARRYRNLKIEEVSRKINIQAKYLLALEDERFESLPAGLYGKNFLKEYAEFLGLNSQELLRSWPEENTAPESNNPFSRALVKKSQFLVLPKIIRNILIAAAIFACLLYLIFYFKNIVSPPKLIITTPENNLMITDSSLVVTGQTEAEAEVRINNETVLNNNNGYFSQTVDLKKGLNNLTITAKKKYGREKVVTRQILVK